MLATHRALCSDAMHRVSVVIFTIRRQTESLRMATMHTVEMEMDIFRRERVDSEEERFRRDALVRTHLEH